MKEKFKHILTLINNATNKVWQLFEAKDPKVKWILKVALFLLAFWAYYSYIGVFK